MELLASSSSSYGLEQLGLSECIQLAGMKDFLINELESNWQNLQHHVNNASLTEELSSVVKQLQEKEHSVLRRSVDDSAESCQDLVCSKEIKELFSQYVSYNNCNINSIKCKLV